jgi:hypothetical protein
MGVSKLNPSGRDDLAWYNQFARLRQRRFPLLSYHHLSHLLIVGRAKEFCLRQFACLMVDDSNTELRSMLDDIDDKEEVKIALREGNNNSEPNPIISGLLSPSWESSEIYEVLIGIVNDFNLLDDAFWRALVRRALVDKRQRSLVLFLNSELFKANGYYYNVARAGRLRSFAPIIVEELDQAISRNYVNYDVHVCMLIEMALRFEHVSLPSSDQSLIPIVTLEQWRNTNPNARTNVLKSVILHDSFLQSFSEVCAINANVMNILDPPIEPHQVVTRESTLLPEISDSDSSRRRQHLLDSLYGFMSIAVLIDASFYSHILAEFCRRIRKLSTSKTAFFDSYFCTVGVGARGQLRDRFVHMMITEKRMRSEFRLAASSGDGFLVSATDFQPNALELLNLSPKSMNGPIFLLLLQCAVKLAEFSPLIIQQLDFMSGNSSQNFQLGVVLNAIKNRPILDFFPEGETKPACFTLQGVRDCTRAMARAKAILLTMPAAASRLQDMFQHVLKAANPVTWVKYMEGAQTIAFFIKYIDRENLDLAYEAFEKSELNKGQLDLLDLLRSVRDAYSSKVSTKALPIPYVDAKAMTLVSGNSDFSSNNLEKIVTDVEASAMNRSNKPLPLDLGAKLTAKWMDLNLERHKLPLAPRNVQIIAFLLFSAWARNRSIGKNQENRALIAQVGTGEGKSLMIAMLAVYAYLHLGKKVVILESNEQLRKRDYDAFSNPWVEGSTKKGFFPHFNIKASIKFSDEAQVCYCLNDDIYGEYRKRIFAGKGKDPFNDTVLIADEVDTLLLDNKTCTYHACKDTGLTADLVDAYIALRDGNSKPDSVSSTVWKAASKAKKDAEDLLEKVNKQNGVRLVDGSYKILDGDSQTDLTSDGLEFLNFWKCSNAVESNSSYYCQSLPRIMSSFGTIFGLSGSLGGQSQRDFVTQLYGARFVQIPNFLDTCVDVRREPPILLNNAVDVFDKTTAKNEAIVALALEKRKTVPVLIIMNGVEQAEKMRDAIAAAMPNDQGTKIDEAGATEVQLYLAESNTGKTSSEVLTNIVSKATELIDGGKVTERFRVTVTDRTGGRGVDYDMGMDDKVNDAGGLLVIISYIPEEGERDWIQWKGRTARKDRRGQYSVMLSRQDEPLYSNMPIIAKTQLPNSRSQCTLELVNELLKIYDDKNKEKLVESAKQSRLEMRINEACDIFWTKYCNAGSPNGRTWPKDDNEERLRDLLESTRRGKDSFDKHLENFVINCNLENSLEIYLRKSKYQV